MPTHFALNHASLTSLIRRDQGTISMNSAICRSILYVCQYTPVGEEATRMTTSEGMAEGVRPAEVSLPHQLLHLPVAAPSSTSVTALPLTTPPPPVLARPRERGTTADTMS